MKMRKNIDKIYKVIEVLFLASMLFYVSMTVIKYYGDKKIEKTIDVGQIWVYNNDINDPFNIENPRFRKVIDMKGDYVKYVTIYHDTLSVKKSVFIEDSKRDMFYRGYYKIDLNK